MSGDEPKKPADYEVGYGRPPVEHQIKKGETKNRKGRPKKRERSLIPRQLRVDILKVKETQVRISTSRGEEEMTLYEAAIFSLAKKAVTGHYSAMKLFLQKCEAAVQQHFDAHREFALLEAMERHAVIEESISPEVLARMNELRAATRKT